MKRVFFIIPCVLLSLFYLGACNSGASSGSGAISTDTAVIGKGRVSFIQNCGGCHNFRRSAIGPSLGGLTDVVSAGWIRHFIRDPQKTITSGDQRAVELYKVYKMAMPSFDRLTNEDIDALIAFIHIHPMPGRRVGWVKGKSPADLFGGTGGRSPVADPIPGRIGPPDLEVGLQLLTQVPASVDNKQSPLARITKLGFEPQTGYTFIVDLRGKLYRLQGDKPVVYMDITQYKKDFIHEPRVATGFGSFAFHPDFIHNGLLYTSHSERMGSGKADFGYGDSIKVALQWVVTEWKATDPGAPAFSGTSRELFRVNMVSAMHGVQEIAFNPLSKKGDADYGLLYICVGDGACVEEGVPFLAHSVDKVWGSILRIDPAGRNSANGKYGIPASNPFAKAGTSGSLTVARTAGSLTADTLKEIYAYGFRNPHRITWTRSGDMLASIVGQTNIEAIDLIMPGHDYGWPVREGDFVLDPYGDLDKVYPLAANDSIYKITYPVAEYDHDEGKAICGGSEYWGTGLPALKGKFLFGDIVTGRLFYIEMADVKQGKRAPVKEWKTVIDGRPKTLLELCGGDRVDLHFGKDARGDLYILTKTDGKIYKLVSAIMR